MKLLTQNSTIIFVAASAQFAVVPAGITLEEGVSKVDRPRIREIQAHLGDRIFPDDDTRPCR